MGMKSRWNRGMTGPDIVEIPLADGEAYPPPDKPKNARMDRDGYTVLSRRPRGFEAGDLRDDDEASAMEDRMGSMMMPMPFPD